MPTPPPRTNLARPPTRFIGRQADLEALRALLASHRLVTVLGPPGTGKTRLALEYGLRHLEDPSPDQGAGVWFCDLTEARDADDVAAALGHALGVPLASGQGGAAPLGAALEARGRLLVILDNFEQVAPLAPRTLGAWLRVA